jgi:hypothetical protein
VTTLQCPECSKGGFKSLGLLGKHRRKVHKATGSTAVALKTKEAEKQSAGKTVPTPVSLASPTPPPATFQCPDCPRTFDRPTGLGIHRRTAHGVVGTSAASVAYRKQREQINAPSTISAPESQALTQQKPKSNGSVSRNRQAHGQVERASDEISDEILLVAVGRFTRIFERPCG